MSAVADGHETLEVLTAHARTLLPEWSVDSDCPLTLLNQSENTTFGVGPDLILRIHRDGYSSLEEISSELAWLRAVRLDTGIVTPTVVPSTTGKEIVSRYSTGLRSERHAVMFKRIPGVEPPDHRVIELFEPLGAIAARLHGHSKQWARPSGFVRRSWDSETSIGRHPHWGSWENGLGVGPNERQVLSRLAVTLTERLNRFGMSPERFGLIHADLRLANLLLNEHGDIAVIDFDDSGCSWFGYDLGASLSFIEDHPQRADLIEKWCDGYRSVAPLDAATVSELMTFVMLRRLVLTAWFGSHPTIELATTIGKTFAAGTCDLAEVFLSQASSRKRDPW
jgi:Ser/Thr protein kinase RdoA (MazF antagonist)